MEPSRVDNASSGASRSQRKLGDALQAWLAHHRSSLASTVNRLLAAKAQTLLTSTVVAIALALPVLLMVALMNLQQLGKGWDAEPKLTLYLHERASQVAIDKLLAELQVDARIDELRYIDAATALLEFETRSGFGRILEGLSENPLPSAIEINLAAGWQSVPQQQALAQEFASLTLVSEADVDLAWVQRFLAITELLRQLVLFLALLLALGALLAIGNTVRLIIENRKDEIIIIKLVGGTNGFVRRPLLYTGSLYGFVGAALALLMVLVVSLLASPKVAAIAAAYNAQFELQGISFLHALQLLAIGTVLGWLGAVLAVGRHLSEIEPS